MHLHHAAGNLRADLYLGERLHASGGLHLLHDVARLHGFGLETRRRRRRGRLPVHEESAHTRDQQAQHDRATKPAARALSSQLLFEIADRVRHQPGLGAVGEFVAHQGKRRTI